MKSQAQAEQRMEDHVKVTSFGSGKAIVLVVEQGGRFSPVALTVATLLAENYKAILFEVASFDEYSWSQRAEELLLQVQGAKVRFACFVGFGGAATLVQYLFFMHPKGLRSIVLIDATTRPHPSRCTRLITKIESLLPIGLPLRSSDVVFNAKPFLQRIRCPALILNTKDATPYQKTEAKVLAAMLPTAWQDSLGNEKLEHLMADKIHAFQSIAAKSPQRRLEVACSL